MTWFKVSLIVCLLWCGVHVAFGGKPENEFVLQKTGTAMKHLYGRQSDTCGVCDGACRDDCGATEMIAPGHCRCAGSAEDCCINDPTAEDCGAGCGGICRYQYCSALEMVAPSGCKCGGDSVCCIDDPSSWPCGNCSGQCRESCEQGEMVAPSGCTCGLGRNCCIRNPVVPECTADCGGECRPECLLGEKQAEGVCYCATIGGQAHTCCVDDPDVQVCSDECDGACRYSDCENPEYLASDGCQCSPASLGDRVCCAAPEGATGLPTEGPTHEGSGEGDPHFVTFDNAKFSFQGNCTYTLVMDCLNDNPSFAVYVKNVAGHNHGHHVSRIAAILVQVGDVSIELHRDLRLLVDNGIVSLAALPLAITTTAGQVVNIVKSQGNLLVSIHPDIVINWDGDRTVEVKIISALSGNVCGLLGDADGLENDDFFDKDGNPLTLHEFVESWVVQGSC